MRTLATVIVALAVAGALTGCTVATTSGGTTATAGTQDQLRRSVDGPLRRAGVSEACIQSLDTTALTQVRALTTRSPRNSKEVLQQRQQLRTFVGRYCPSL